MKNCPDHPESYKKTLMVFPKVKHSLSVFPKWPLRTRTKVIKLSLQTVDTSSLY